MSGPASEAIGRAIEGYVALGGLAEEIEDEWQYVNDLVNTYRGELEALAARAGDGEPPAGAVEAVDAATEEISLITDPHRAIDWLSTFPQIVLLAFEGVNGVVRVAVGGKA